MPEEEIVMDVKPEGASVAKLLYEVEVALKFYSHLPPIFCTNLWSEYRRTACLRRGGQSFRLSRGLNLHS